MVAGGLALMVICLAVERRLLSSRLRQIPLRICITGTRGKSTVTRLVAAAMRQAGRRVMAKTTGSQATLILPEGKEEKILRRGTPSILEAKKLLKRASRLRVDVLVSELMSIRPECLYTESVQMLAPHILILTNIRVDHLAQMGRSSEDVARSLATAIPGHATVFLPEEELSPVFEDTARLMGSRLEPVPRESGSLLQEAPALQFGSNIRLALAVAEFCGIDSETALRGMRSARSDFGALKVWTADLGSPARHWYLVSAFAANDPESTRESLDKVGEKIDFGGMRLTGLLNLRSDRGDRTLQWSQALECEPYSRFDRVYFLGDQARALRSKLPAGGTRWCVLQAKEPVRIMEEITQKTGDDSVLIGMGNMGGAGAELVRHWEKIGKAS